VEVLETDEKATMAALDQECNVPHIRQHADQRTKSQLITLQARVVRGKLQ
jgi:hypothetical protein